MTLRLTLLFALLFSLHCSIAQEDPLHVLFIGNSYTQANDLPSIVAGFSETAGTPVITENCSLGGYTFEAHSTNANTLTTIEQGIWDIVVMQEQSQIPTIDYYRYHSMYPSATTLQEHIQQYNPCAKIILFMTWGRRFGGMQCDDTGTHCSPDFIDFSHMQDSLESAYVMLSNDNQVVVAPAGIAWKQVITTSEMVLHTGDNSHPNLLGSYVTGAVLYSMIWKQSPMGIPYYSSLEIEDATFLQTAANTAVFLHENNWNINIYTPETAFDYWQNDSLVTFQNGTNPIEDNSYYWDFGDGDYATEENPTHLYTANGDYIVTLIASHCGESDTAWQTVTIDNYVSIPVKEQQPYSLSPNPASNTLFIQHQAISPPSQSYTIFSANGNRIKEGKLNTSNRSSISLQGLCNGVYYIQINNAELQSLQTIKFIIHHN